MKNIVTLTLSILLLISVTIGAYADGTGQLNFTDNEAVDASVFEDTAVTVSEVPEISAPSAILIEKETGTVIFEKDADKIMEPASVTKVMTILLIVESIERGDISTEEIITCSARASSMGGSQVYLKEGEQMTLHDMLKSIVVSSANDAAVAVAEHMYGSEAAFVSQMNARAAELGMTNTCFKNCTGLMDDSEHVTTARDIAIMSRELISHDMIKEYTTIWMDTIRNGEFGLTNTNKLIRFYEGATGLKTGFTSRSMYCLSATAERDGVEFIAVIMHGETSVKRFEDAKTLLSYGFANYTLVNTTPQEILPPVPVKLGKNATVQPVVSEHSNLLLSKNAAKNVDINVELCEIISAPVFQGSKMGIVTVTSEGEILCQYDIIASENVPRLTFFEIFKKCLSLLYKNEL